MSGERAGQRHRAPPHAADVERRRTPPPRAAVRRRAARSRAACGTETSRTRSPRRARRAARRSPPSHETARRQSDRRGSAPPRISAVCSESGDVRCARDEIVEQREHDEVQHDRRDHFVRAELRLEHARESRRPRRRQSPRRGCTPATSSSAGNPGRQQQPDQRRDESARGELALGADVEQSGAQARARRQGR